MEKKKNGTKRLTRETRRNKKYTDDKSVIIIEQRANPNFKFGIKTIFRFFFVTRTTYDELILSNYMKSKIVSAPFGKKNTSKFQKAKNK